MTKHRGTVSTGSRAHPGQGNCQSHKRKVKENSKGTNSVNMFQFIDKFKFLYTNADQLRNRMIEL